VGDNANAFRGGFLMWDNAPKSESPAVQMGPPVATKLRTKVRSKQS
jgi:hypothetical protein